MIVFLSCTKEKKNKRCKAIEMYSESDLYSKCLEYAKKLKYDKLYILSAKHHVLEPDDIISPYNVTLNDFSIEQKKQWTDKVIKILKEKNINFDEKVYFLCGDSYIEFLKKYFTNYECVFEDKGGIGDIMHWLDKENKSTYESLKDFLLKKI